MLQPVTIINFIQFIIFEVFVSGYDKIEQMFNSVTGLK